MSMHDRHSECLQAIGEVALFRGVTHPEVDAAAWSSAARAQVEEMVREGRDPDRPVGEVDPAPILMRDKNEQRLRVIRGECIGEVTSSRRGPDLGPERTRGLTHRVLQVGLPPAADHQGRELRLVGIEAVADQGVGIDPVACRARECMKVVVELGGRRREQQAQRRAEKARQVLRNRHLAQRRTPAARPRVQRAYVGERFGRDESAQHTDAKRSPDIEEREAGPPFANDQPRLTGEASLERNE